MHFICFLRLQPYLLYACLHFLQLIQKTKPLARFCKKKHAFPCVELKKYSLYNVKKHFQQPVYQSRSSYPESRPHLQIQLFCLSSFQVTIQFPPLRQVQLLHHPHLGPCSSFSCFFCVFSQLGLLRLLLYHPLILHQTHLKEQRKQTLHQSLCVMVQMMGCLLQMKKLELILLPPSEVTF